MRIPTEKTKCSHACTYCRAKKAKCSGTQPCTSCTDHGEECVYPEIQPRTRKRQYKEKTIDERFARLEAALQASLTQRTFSSPILPADMNGTDTASQPQGFNMLGPIAELFSPIYGTPATKIPGVMGPVPQEESYSRAATSVSDFHLSKSAQASENARTFSPSSGRTSSDTLYMDSSSKRPRRWRRNTPPESRGAMEAQASDLPPSPPSTTVIEDGSSAYGGNNSEPQRPDTYLSICSDGAIDWVTREIGFGDFISTARGLTADVMRHEKLQERVGLERIPEPDFETAMRWTTAFFKEGLDSVYGVVHRPAFEARLRQHFSRGHERLADPAWYALRNTVYASGCRLELSAEDSPSSFTNARTQAWRYYENALSVHTDLIYSRSDITAVQALLFMAFFAEALGSPAIEFMLMSNATRLAQSKGMHLQVGPGWKMKDDDIQVRQWLWWCIYSYDKHMAYRSGRPSMIDDDDISCPIPAQVPKGSTINICFFQSTIRHAQISSKIAKRLSTVKAMQQTPEQTLAIVQELEQELNAWHQALPQEFRSKPPFRHTELPASIQLFHIIFLHFSYYGSLIAIHTVYCYPWNRPSSEKSQNPSIQAQRRRSTEVVADASRNMIRATQRLQITAASPVWLTFYFPLIGLINLFVYVLKYPHLPTVQSDISLMDVVVGHFGYLEYASASELRFPFPREIVGYARSFLKHKREGSSPRLCNPQNGSVAAPEREKPNFTDFTLPELLNSETDDFQLEDWPSFLPSFSGVTTMMRHEHPQPENVDLLLSQL